MSGELTTAQGAIGRNQPARRAPWPLGERDVNTSDGGRIKITKLKGAGLEKCQRHNTGSPCWRIGKPDKAQNAKSLTRANHMRKNCLGVMSARLKRTWPFQNVSPVNEAGPRRNLSSLPMQFLTPDDVPIVDPDEPVHRLCQHWVQHLRGAQHQYPERPGPNDSVLYAAGAPRCDLVCCFG